MNDFLARVELHKASYDDYERLHSSMKKKGYDRVITGNDGNTYQLPTGTYVARSTNATIEVALKAATEAADETGKTSSTIVVSWTSARWNGLSRV